MNGTKAVREVAPARDEVFARWQRELAESMEQEAEVARELREALLRQREGVATLDHAAVDGSVDAIGRVLHTLEQAKRRRIELVSTVTGSPDTALEELEGTLGVPLSAELLKARSRLRRAAQDVAQEVAINRAVLRRAVEAGEAFVQALFSTVSGPAPAYTPSERADAPSATGVLVNRRA
jgi:hypothetical protein